jgi:hypothetical protein
VGFVDASYVNYVIVYRNLEPDESELYYEQLYGVVDFQLQHALLKILQLQMVWR